MSPPPGLQWWFVGPHEVMIEGADLVFVCCVGEMSAAHAQQIMHLAETHLARLAGAYMIVDLRQGGGLPRDARRLVADWLREHHLAAVVNFGASAVSRAFSNLAIRALRALYGGTVENVFTDSEAEARAWIARHRTQRRAP